MLAAATEEEQRRSIVESLSAAAVSRQDLWLEYFALGGIAGELEVEAYLAGAMPLPVMQCDVLAHALNEHLRGEAPPAGARYSYTIRDRLPDRGPLAALAHLLVGASEAAADQIAALAAQAGDLLGLQARIYLADYQQRELIALPLAGQPAAEPQPLDTTMAGRTFRLLQATASHTDVNRWWLPILAGKERLGVLDVTVTNPADLTDPLLREQCQWLASMLGYLLVVADRSGDAVDAVRRQAPRSDAAELVWSLLPPLTAATERCTIAGAVEPCYEVGGDTFDYTLSDTTATFAIFDAMGHGLSAGLLSAVALGSSRAARRNGIGLLARANDIDDAVVHHAAGEAFVTGILAELDLLTGRLRFIAAGHPAPLLLRAGHVVTALSEGRRLPFGLGDGMHSLAEVMLEPGDWLALHTDGITEARDPAGTFFSTPRLVDFLEREAAAAQPAPETLRRLIHAVLDHQNGVLQDDATIVLAHWHPQTAHER